MDNPKEVVEQLQNWEKINKKRAPRLAKRPILVGIQPELWRAYQFIARRRQSGMAAQPLTLESMVIYAQTWGFDDDLRFFLYVISEMDDEALLYHAEKQEREKEQNKLNKPPSKKKTR